MDKLKICFVGVGSIAARHIKNLREIGKTWGIELVIDAYRRVMMPFRGVNTTYDKLETMPSDYDVVFITNPTNMHLDTLKRFHNKGRHFFIEKPVVSLDQIDEAKKFHQRKESIYYVACPLRYNAVIQWIKNNINLEEILSVRSISSSYLPDWRPGQDYRETYSAHKDMGGGVSIDLIHEWDYLTYLFGWPEKIYSVMGKHSDLEIDSDDYALYIAEYRNMTVELHLDYFGRKTIRQIEIFTKKDTILGDIVNNRVKFLKSGENIIFQEERNDYQKRELIYFLNLISHNYVMENGYLHGIKVLDVTQGRL